MVLPCRSLLERVLRGCKVTCQKQAPSARARGTMEPTLRGGGVSLQNYAFAIHLMSRGNGIGNPRLAQSLRTKSSFKYAERASVDSTRSTKTQSSSTLTTRVPHARAYRELVKAATSTILSFSSTRPNASTKARPSGPRFLSRVSASMTRSHGVPAAPRTDSGLE